ncbi:MAG: hypothetical protein STSR0001_25050 [Methanothrix sp.]
MSTGSYTKVELPYNPLEIQAGTINCDVGILFVQGDTLVIHHAEALAGKENNPTARDIAKPLFYLFERHLDVNYSTSRY